MDYREAWNELHKRIDGACLNLFLLSQNEPNEEKRRIQERCSGLSIAKIFMEDIERKTGS